MVDDSRAQGPTLDEMRRGPFVPGRNSDPAALAIKHQHLWDPHVAPFNALADAIADAEGIERGLVPYVDPQLGGVHGRVLALLDNPSTKAEAGTGSGLLSLENDDRTAKNCAAFYNDLGIGPELLVHWNVAPAPIAGEKNGASSVPERERGAAWLREVVAAMPDLRVVLLMGDHARDGWKRSGLDPRGVFIPDNVPHPSQRGLNNNDGRVRLRNALLESKEVLEGRRKLPRSTPVVHRVRERVAGLAQTIRPETGRGATKPASSGRWGWWPTFEHYCAPGSDPWGTSEDMARIERAVDRHDGPPAKWCVIARRRGSDWTLVYRRKDGYTKELADYQVVKYDAARAGGPRGNLGKVPPSSQLRRTPRNLDA